MRRCGCPDCRSARRQNQGQVVDQCPCDGNALLLASRQLGRPMSRAIHEPDAPEQLHGSVMTLASRYTGIDERQLDVSRRGQSRRRLKFWNTNPIRLLRIRLSSSSSSRPTSRPEQIVSRPDVGRSRQPIMFIRVDLPEPDGPISAAFTRIDRASIRSRNLCPRADTISTGSSGHHRLDASRWVHSYRNASIGSSDAARRAGIQSKKTPTAADTVTAITMACNENTIFHPRTAQSKSEQDAGQNTITADTAHDDRLDQKLPENLPARRPDPRIPDLADPCVTLASMMFMIPMRRPGEIAAIAASTMLKVRCVA